jgi:hypothetical protein
MSISLALLAGPRLRWLNDLFEERLLGAFPLRSDTTVSCVTATPRVISQVRLPGRCEMRRRLDPRQVPDALDAWPEDLAGLGPDN